jgi:excisionase family DNA binding protein
VPRYLPGVDTFLTVAEVAELLKLNQQTLRNRINEGSLPAYHVGRRVRISRADLDRIIEQGYSRGRAGSGPGPAPSIRDGEIPPPAAPGD